MPTQDSDLANLSIFPGTREQIIESRRRTFAQWGNAYIIEEYLHRDEIMDGDEHATNGKYITWILAPRNDPATLDFKCSCKTFRRTAVVSPRGTTTTSDATAYGIATVYTPPHHRRRGYAQHMMRLLHWALRPRSSLDVFPTSQWGAPPDAGMLKKLGLANAALSVLYSDVGPEFYRACGTKPGTRDGWTTLGARATFLRLLASASDDDYSGDGGAGGRVALLTVDDARALYAHDARWLRADVARVAAADPERIQFSFLPDAGVGAYSVRRTMSFAAAKEPGEALQPVSPLQHWGAVLLRKGTETFADTLELLATSASASASASGEEGGTGSPRCDFITWTLDPAPPRTLVAARTRASPTTFPRLLAAFLRAARGAGCERAEFWGLAPELRAVAEGQGQGWETGKRTEHLSAVKRYGLEGEGEDGGGLDWLHNEKFCWC